MESVCTFFGSNNFHAILPLHFLKQLKKTFMSLNLFIVLCFYLIVTHLGMFFIFVVVSMTTASKYSLSPLLLFLECVLCFLIVVLCT